MAFRSVAVQSNGANIGMHAHGKATEPFDGRLNLFNRAKAFDVRKTGVVVMQCAGKFFADRDFQRKVTGVAATDVAKLVKSRGKGDEGLAGLLSRSRPVVSCDMRGQVIRGTRADSADRANFTIDKYMDDIEAIRNRLGSEQLALCAYSPGGFFAAHYAIRNPHRVSALVLIEPAIYTEKDDLVQRAKLAEDGDGVKSMEAMLSYVDPTLDAGTRYQMAVNIVADWQSPEIIGHVYRLHAEAPITDAMLEPLRKIPVLMIGGTNSAMSFHVKRIAAAVPEATVWWIKGADHLSLMNKQNCEQIASVVESFLATR